MDFKVTMFSPLARSVEVAWEQALASDQPNILNKFPGLFGQRHADRLDRYLHDKGYRAADFSLRDGSFSFV